MSIAAISYGHAHHGTCMARIIKIYVYINKTINMQNYFVYIDYTNKVIMNLSQINSSKYMRPHKYKSAFVTWPYYYNYHSVPYYESKLIFEHDMKYDPYQIFSPDTVLRDGTIIEGFTEPIFSRFTAFILLIIILLFIYKIKK